MVEGRRNPVGNSEGPRARRKQERTVTILLVDGRAWTREALARALEKAGRDLRVLPFGSVAEMSQANLPSGPAIILLNLTGIRLLHPSVSAAIATAAAALNGAPVVALSDREDGEEIMSAIDRGLSGYIPMSLELRSVVEALRFVAAGGTFVPAEPLLAGLALNEPQNPLRPPSVGTAPEGASLDELTPRELAVLDLLRQAKSNKHIARELDLSEATVKVHVRHLMRKLGAVNRTQAALLAEHLLS